MADKKIGFYVCALVDILGQKVALKELDDIKSLGDDKERVNEIFQEAYGKVKKLRNSIHEYTKQPNQKKNYSLLSSSPEIKYNLFSDLVVLYLSLSRDGKNLDIGRLKYMLLCLSGSFLEMLSLETPLRGGVDIGIAVVENNDQLYGCALSKAYHLESNVADSIRLVVGQELVDFLDEACSKCDDAAFCRRLIKKDIDDVYILDYLSQVFHMVPSFSEMKDRARVFLEKENKKFQVVCDDKNAEKYQKALDYFNE